MGLVTLDPLDAQQLDGLGPEARRAVAAAETIARELDHGRLGTEHLLLGILEDDTTVGFGLLRDVGVTASAARHQAIEAVGPPTERPRPGAQLPVTARASRAWGRSVRFSHQRRAPEVDATLLLLGVLDVEGTAGQVLRKLGVDLDRLLAAIDSVHPHAEDVAARSSSSSGPDPTADGTTETAPPVCAACRGPLDGGITAHDVGVQGRSDLPSVVLLACPTCGATVGVVPATRR